MRIRSVNFISAKSKFKEGLYIQFVSQENINHNAFLKVTFKDKDHYFQVSEKSVKGTYLDVSAIEIGYWANRFSEDVSFDIRNLLGLQIEIISDELIIKKIAEMNSWC